MQPVARLHDNEYCRYGLHRATCRWVAEERKAWQLIHVKARSTSTTSPQPGSPLLFSSKVVLPSTAASSAAVEAGVRALQPAKRASAMPGMSASAARSACGGKKRTFALIVFETGCEITGVMFVLQIFVSFLSFNP